MFLSNEASTGSLFVNDVYSQGFIINRNAFEKIFQAVDDLVSHNNSHEWMVEAAQSVADLEEQAGSYRKLVQWRSVVNPEIAWDSVSFDGIEEFGVVELTVRRVGGDDYVHINEWTLESLNPACGQGVDLSTVEGYGFDRDVDSVARTGAWDIGADQSSE